MAKETLACYVLPTLPLPLLLPRDCVAEVVSEPQLQYLDNAPASWMKANLVWQNQHLPVISYSLLVDANAVESEDLSLSVAVLNPIPDAARKAFAGIVCRGTVEAVTVEEDIEYVNLPEGVDRRYVEAVVKIADQQYIIPKLAALGVALSYF